MDSEPRFFVDSRVGCIAVRDRDKTDPEYQGLHHNTEGVVWYEHGEQRGNQWVLKVGAYERAVVTASTLNANHAQTRLTALERRQGNSPKTLDGSQPEIKPPPGTCLITQDQIDAIEREARNAALEEAAKVVTRAAHKAEHEHANRPHAAEFLCDAAHAIRALKSP